jgi:hypothetical protein
LISPRREYTVPDLLHFGGYEILTLGISTLFKFDETGIFEYGKLPGSKPYNVAPNLNWTGSCVIYTEVV